MLPSIPLYDAYLLLVTAASYHSLTDWSFTRWVNNYYILAHPYLIIRTVAMVWEGVRKGTGNGPDTEALEGSEAER